MDNFDQLIRQKEIYKDTALADSHSNLVDQHIKNTNPIDLNYKPILTFTPGEYTFTNEQLQLLEYVTSYRINKKGEKDNIYDTDMSTLKFDNWDNINNYKGGLFLTLLDNFTIQTEMNISYLNIVYFLEHLGLLYNDTVYFCKQDPSISTQVNLFKLLEDTEDGSMIKINKEDQSDFDWNVNIQTKDWDVNKIKNLVQELYAGETNVQQQINNNLLRYEKFVNNTNNTFINNQIKLSNKDYYHKITMINNTINQHNLFQKHYKILKDNWITNDNKITLLKLGNKPLSIGNFKLNCKLLRSDSSYKRYKLTSNNKIEMVRPIKLGELCTQIDHLYSKTELIVLHIKDDQYYCRKQDKKWYSFTENVIKTCYSRLNNILDNIPQTTNKELKDMDKNNILIPESIFIKVLSFILIEDTDIPMTNKNYWDRNQDTFTTREDYYSNSIVRFYREETEPITNDQVTELIDSLTTDILHLKLYGPYIGDTLYINDDGIKKLADVLTTNNTLKTFTFTRGIITDVGMRALANAFKVNTSLITLNLSSNIIKNNGV